MLKRIVTLLFGVLLFSQTTDAKLILSPASTISLITCSPGTEAYALFGHSAIRIFDPKYGMDQVFNYGLFSFDTPNFYMKFIEGRTDYLLGVHDFRLFFNAYVRENRSIYEHKLALDSVQKQAMLDNLVENLKPENCIYRYNFLFNNCSSRIRDLFETTLGDKLKWHEIRELPTFREELNLYLNKSLWIKTGINLIMGSNIDRVTTYRETMFIPDFLMGGVTLATLDDHPFFFDEKTLTKAKEIDESKGIRPYALFLILLHIIIFTGFTKLRESKIYSPVISVYYFIIGLLGIVLWYISLLSVHPGVFPNIHLLWLWPTHLLLPIWAFRKELPKFVTIYLKVNIALALLADLLLILQIQKAPADIIILINMLIIANLSLQRKHTPIRHIINYFKARKAKQNTIVA